MLSIHSFIEYCKVILQDYHIYHEVHFLKGKSYAIRSYILKKKTPISSGVCKNKHHIQLHNNKNYAL